MMMIMIRVIIFLISISQSAKLECIFCFVSGFRNAKKKEILKAYRLLAMKWHPDKHEGPEKEKAQKVFIDLAAAKEVLTDPGKYMLLGSS